MKLTSEKSSSWQPGVAAMAQAQSYAGPDQFAGEGESEPDCAGELRFLHRVARRLSVLEPMAEILNDVAGFIAERLACDLCEIFVLESDELVLRASSHLSHAGIPNLRINVGGHAAAWAARHKWPVVVSERAVTDSRSRQFVRAAGKRFEAVLSAPLGSCKRTGGLINVYSVDSRQFSQSHVSLAATAGFLLGSEIERQRVESRNLHFKRRLGLT